MDARTDRLARTIDECAARYVYATTTDADKRFAERTAERAARRAAERERPVRTCPTERCSVERTTAEQCPDCGAATTAPNG